MACFRDSAMSAKRAKEANEFLLAFLSNASSALLLVDDLRRAILDGQTALSFYSRALAQPLAGD